MTTKASRLFATAVALIALHVLDDNFLQPEPGTSAADHLLSGLVPLAVLAAAAWWHPRASGARRGALSLVLGVFGIVAGVEAIYYTREVGPSGDDFTGWLTIPAGLALLGVGALTLWRTRRRGGPRPRRYARRGAYGLAAVLAAVVVVPLSLGYLYTHLQRAQVPENRLGMASENVAFETSDGLTLKGWYVPSRNGAAVIAFPGRKGPQPHTRMLARHGYGVLLFDRRGEGASDGDPNSYGWGGEKDIEAAVAYLRHRPDVDPERIGGIGLSVGGELMIQAAAGTPALKAVVSDGAGYRSIRESEDMPRGTLVDTLVGLPAGAVMTAGVTVFSNHAPPADLKRYAARIAPRPLLLIADPDSGHTEELNAGFYGAAGEPKALWEIPGAGHVGGIRTRAAEYERRVVGFFDRALRTS